MTLTQAPPPTNNQPPQDPELAALDQLIPAPITPNRRLLVAVALIAAAMLAAWFIGAGYLFPRPGAHIKSPGLSGNDIALDIERDVLGFGVYLYNEGGRDLRLTDIAFDVAGIELVDVEVDQPIAFDGSLAHGHDLPYMPSCPYGVRNDGVCGMGVGLRGNGRALPVVVPATSETAIHVVLWVRPTDCALVEPSEGIMEATVDFGASSIPPFSITERLEKVPVWSISPDPFFLNRETTYHTAKPNGETVTAASRAELVCELLR